MFHCYFENPSKYSYLLLIFKVPLFYLILPCKIYQRYTKLCKLSTEWEDASLHLLSPLSTWHNVTSHSVYRNIIHTHKMLWNATGIAEMNKNGSSLYPFLCLGGCLLILLRCHLVDLCILKQRIECSALKIKGISDLILSQSRLL